MGADDGNWRCVLSNSVSSHDALERDFTMCFVYFVQGFTFSPIGSSLNQPVVRALHVVGFAMATQKVGRSVSQ
jgi:hypothetical protein